MLTERPDLHNERGFSTCNMKPTTMIKLERLAKQLGWNKYEVMHALVEAALEARKEPKP